MKTPCEMFSVSLKRNVVVEEPAVFCVARFLSSSRQLKGYMSDRYSCSYKVNGKKITKIIKRSDLIEVGASGIELSEEENWD